MTAYCVSDLHGQYSAFKKIKSFLQEDDVCYVLGDVIDRGNLSIAILLSIMEDSRFKFIRGNHEEMMLAAFDESCPFKEVNKQIWLRNGGLQTDEEFSHYSYDTQQKVLQFLKDSPLKLEYKNYILTHAGFDFGVELEDPLEILWNRNHIKSERRSLDEKIQVHGHTPTPNIKKEHKGILQYAPDKICVDTGCFFTNVVQMYNLDTKEIIDLAQ